MPRLPGPDEPHFFARDPASDVLRTHRAAEDEAALRTLDSALLRRRAEFDARTLDEDDLEFGPLSGPPDATPSFDERVQDLIDPFAGSRVEARARSLADTHRKAFEARTNLAGHQRSDRRMVKTLERVLEDNKQAVTMQPGLIDMALARADTALDKTATALDWSDEEREAQRAAFDKDLAQRLLRADIAKGNTQSVLQELDDDDLALDPETTAILRREAETAQGHARAAFQADADAAMEDVDESAGAALIAQANDILAEDEREAFAERVRAAQADAVFRTAIRFMTPEAVAAAIDRDVDPLEPLVADTRERRWAIAREVLEARAQDPAGDLMADPTVAGWFADGTSLETALSRRLQAQRDIGVVNPQVLPRDEAQSLAAELNSLPPAARAGRIAELVEQNGQHYLQALAELTGQGLDRPAQALAAAMGNPALLQALVEAQTVGRAGLRDGVSEADRAAMTDAVRQTLDRIADDRDIDARGFRFAAEDLAFLFFRQTGDIQSASEDAARLIVGQLEALVSTQENRLGDRADRFPERLIFVSSKSKKLKRKKEKDRQLDAIEMAGRRRGEDNLLSDEEVGELKEAIASVIPGVGNVLSAADAIEAAQIAVEALENDDIAGALEASAEAAIAALGALPGGGMAVRGGKSVVKIAGILFKNLRRRRNAEVARKQREGSKKFKIDRIKLPKVSRTKDPITPDEFSKLPDKGFIDPNRIRTSQNNADRKFQQEPDKPLGELRRLEETVHELIVDENKNRTIEPIHIALIDGKVYTLDNRRVVAHRIPGRKIRFVKATEAEIAKALDKGRISTKTTGMSIDVRGMSNGRK